MTYKYGTQKKTEYEFPKLVFCITWPNETKPEKKGKIDKNVFS